MKYVCFCFDDGTIYDRQLIDLMNHYQIKGTFSLNSGLANYAWYCKGQLILRPCLEEVAYLYEGHEVCGHSLTHKFLDQISIEELVPEIDDDKKNIEKVFHHTIQGFSLPFSSCQEAVVSEIKKAGYDYIKTPLRTKSFIHEEDNFHLKVNGIQGEDNFLLILKEFLLDSHRDSLCILTGHSYEFKIYHTWDKIEKVFQWISKQDHVETTSLETALNALKRIA